MILALPDKHIRKEIYDRLTAVNIPCYDYRLTGAEIPQKYVLMTTQTNSVRHLSKCGDSYESSILLEIIVTYSGTLNTGSRLEADNMLDEVRAACNNLTIPNYNVYKLDMDFPNDLVTITREENVFRKFIRIELGLN